MKPCDWIAPLLAVALLGLSPQARCAAPPAAATAPTPSPTPGVELAQTLSLVTGVAISPLFGTGAVGAWKYYQAKTPQERARLPWFAQPWFWIPALLLVTLCFLKNTAGLAVPRLLKKPLDAAEVVEHKLSGLLATGAFVPLIIPALHLVNPDPSALNHSGFLALIELPSLATLVVVPLMMLIFFIVCLASSTINILILLSPFRAVDLALNGLRLFLLSTVALTSFANPWFGALWALIIISFAYLIAGWSFRLSHFGLVFIWDWVTRRWQRFTPDPARNCVYLGRKLNRVPVRTYGALLRDAQGNLMLRYRPWLVLPARTLELPPGQYAVAKGLFYSEVVREQCESPETTLLLPPRYQSHESELTSIYGFSSVREAGVLALLLWLKALLGLKPNPGTPTASA